MPLQSLREKIIKAVPDIVIKYDDGKGFKGIDERLITLEDILRASDINSTDNNWIISVSSNLMRIEYKGIVAIYQLGIPLSQQSPECIEELDKIIH